MQICQERAVLAAAPSEKVKRASERFIGSCAARIGCRQIPGCGVSLIETQNSPNVVLDFYFVKIRRGLWPLHFPTRRLREIAFMRAIPLCRSKFGNSEPDNCCGR